MREIASLKLNMKVCDAIPGTLNVVSEENAAINEPLPGVLGNTGTVAFIFREQGIFSNYFQGTGELLTRLLGSREHQFTFNNGQ